MRTFKLMRHRANQHGFSVSLTKYDEAGELVAGFVLNSFQTEEEQMKFIDDLQEMTGFEYDDVGC